MAERPGEGGEPKSAEEVGLPTSPRGGAEPTVIAAQLSSVDPASGQASGEAAPLSGVERTMIATGIATGIPSASASEGGVVRVSREAMDTLIAGASAARREVSALRVGDTVGRYRIQGQLGAGGMGTVYLAHDPDLDRRVAIKVLHSRVSADAPSLGSQRLLREAQAMARLAHPNVVTVHDVGVVGESLFVAMELIDGDDLRGWLDKGPRGWREIVAAFIEAGQGLAAAHAAEIVHRDFKPDNVMVAASGRICVGDFGLAAAAQAPQATRPSAEPKGDMTSSWLSSAGTLTVPGAVMGTPAYMAPEQMVGGEITPAADIFSFCVALYEALFDQRPFAGASVAAIYLAISQGEIAPLPKGKVPRRLERLIRRGLALEPDDRPPSIEAVLAELRSLVEPKTLRWLSLGALGVAVVAVGVALGSGAEELASCDGGGEEVAEIWSRERADRLKEAFEATEVIHATATWGRVEASVERTLSRWQDARREACEETHHSGQFSEEILALRVACLGRQLGEIDALLDFLADGDKKVVDNAVQVVSGLPDPQACDPAAVLAEASRERPAELDALEQELAMAKRLHQAGKYPEALAILEPLRQEARALGDPEFEAEVQMRLSHTVYIDRGEEAGALLREALEANLRAGRDLAFARTAADQLGLVASDPEGRELWLRLGEAALDRAEADGGSRDSVLAKLKTNYGNALRNSGRLKEALVVHEEALRLRRRVDESSYLVGDSTFNVASSLATLERYDQAVALIREAIAIWERELGSQHPRMVRAHRNLAIISKLEGDNRAALSAAQEALALSERLWGKEHPRLINVLMVVSIVQNWQGNFVESAEASARARAIAEVQPSKVELEPMYMQIADTEVSLGNFDRGEVFLEKARALTDDRPPEDMFWREYYGLRTEIALRRGDYVTAQGELDRAWAADKAHGSVHSGLFGYTALRAAELALHRGELGKGLSGLALFESEHPLPLKQDLMQGMLLWARARLLHRSGRDAQARVLAAEALAALGDLGAGYEPMRQDIRAWLKEHGPA